MKPVVLIIGAGMAGLAAGYALTAQGVACRLLERGSYPGGRLDARAAQSTGDPNASSQAPPRAIYVLSTQDAQTLEILKVLGLTSRLRLASGLRIAVGRRRYKAASRWPYLPWLSAQENLCCWRLRARLRAYSSGRRSSASELARRFAQYTAAQYISKQAGETLLRRYWAPCLQAWADVPAEQMSMEYAMQVLARHQNARTIMGLEGLPRRLAAGLEIAWEHEALRILVAHQRVQGIVLRHGAKEEVWPAQAIICATQADAAATLLAEVPATVSLLQQCVYLDTSVLTFKVPRTGPWEWIVPLNPEGLAAPSSILYHPGGDEDATQAQVQVKFTGTWQRQQHETIITQTKTLLQNTWPAWQGDCHLSGVQVYPQARPVCKPGHRQLLAQIAKTVAPLTGLELAGDYFQGGCIEAAVQSGLSAAQAILKEVS